MLLIVALVFVPACDPNVSIRDGTTDAPKLSATESSDGRITIAALGLSFRLPTSFEVVDDPSSTFFARSDIPPALFSIERDDPSVVNHEPEGPESVRRADIDGVEAVVVENAVLEGLPAGLAARELLVANGDRSFSAILSAPEAELPQLWDRLITTIRIHST